MERDRRLSAPPGKAQTHSTHRAHSNSSTTLPLDEGDAVVGLASQRGVAEAVQTLPQLDKGLLHDGPGGWGGRAGGQ